MLIIIYGLIILKRKWNRTSSQTREYFGNGPRGPQGLAGPPGPIGGPGINGPRGVPGPQGLPGPIGPQGIKGNEGRRGVPGERGAVGPMGSPGQRGFDGFPGPQGSIGPKGERGDIGKDGPAGVKGDPGRKGSKGDRGWPGFKGDPGTVGENSCKYFGSDQESGWQCPDDYPIYTGATLGAEGQLLTCNGGIAKNATCRASAGLGAKGIAFVSSSGMVTDIRITDPGSGYQQAPLIRIVGQGIGTVAKAIVSNGQVAGIIILNGGQDHQNPPEIHFETIDGGFGAVGEALTENGQIVGVNVINPGQNYQSPPIINFLGGNGSGAEAISHVNDGYLVSISVKKAGSGYTASPLVQILPKPSKQSCGFCHMCCKRPPKQKSLKPDQLGYSLPIEDRVQTNEDKLNEIMSQLEQLQYYKFLQQQQPTCELKNQIKQPTIIAKKTPQVSNQTLNKNIPSKTAPDLSKLPTDMQDNIRRQQQKKLDDANTQEQTLSDLVSKNPDFQKGIEYPPSFSQKDIQQLQEYGTMIADNQSLQASKQVRQNLEEKRINASAQTQKYRNWAPQGKASQSSNYQNKYPANFASDGKLDTFNHTDMGQSWWQVELPVLVSIRKIVVRNRLGTYQIKSRLTPFNITITNSNGAVVGSKSYDDVQDTYEWDQIYLVGKLVRIELVNQNYLHMAEVEVYGEEAKECSDYLNKYNETTKEINQRLIKYSNVPQDMTNKKNHLKTLSDSCQKLTPVDQKKRKELITEEAKAYDAVLELQQKENNVKRTEAQQKLTQIQAAQKQEALATEQAKKLGLPPPPPRYSAEEVAEVNKDLQQSQIMTMTTDQKASCMGLLNDATQKRSAAEELGQVAQYIPFLIPAAKSKGDDSESAWSKYNAACEN